jgi:23S rRNA (adenine2503-C2)-methyltransferase
MLALYRPDISELLDRAAWPLYRHAQVYEHLLHLPLHPFSEATSLPTEARAALETLGCSTLGLLERRVAPDGTSKLLLAGRDGRAVEAVLMRYKGRVTVCVSSQVGCPVGCLFCATGGMGFHRNLSTAEIVDQIRTALVIASGEDCRVSNVVYMGMGEPLLNLKAVVDSIRVLTDPRGIGLAHRAISVSTVGIPSGMIRLGRAEPQVNLALSLHAPDDDTRSLLIPDRYRHPLAEVLHAAWEHFALTRRKLLIEYVLIRGVNDSPQHARALAQLLRGHVVTVNLLAWNPISRGRDAERRENAGARASRFQPSTPAAIAAFRETLVAHHVETVVRRSKGGTIQGACGQLAGKRAPGGEVSSGDASEDVATAGLSTDTN